MRAGLIGSIMMIWVNTFIQGQNTHTIDSLDRITSHKEINGFFRGGFYTWTDQSDRKLFIPTAYSDAGMIIRFLNDRGYQAYADLRYRYGVEFQEPVSRFDVREAWIDMYGKKWSFSGGQKIIRWGRCDFTNPTSSLSPRNMVSRSPDREDINMGNLLADLRLYPFNVMTLETVFVPFYRPSILIIDPVPLPENVVINQLNSLIGDIGMYSYGLKSDFHLKPFDFSLSWFNGYNPMPGIALTDFNIDISPPVPVPHTELSVKPYKNTVLGIDFETVIAGRLGIRGEAAWSNPELSYEEYEYIPLPEIKWTLGSDLSTGAFRFIIEYSGKYVLDFTPAEVKPLIGPEPDYSQFAYLISIPGFDPGSYVRHQVAAFNRLYNNQLKKYYHIAASRIEADLFNGRLFPSLFGMLNITTGDLLVIPEVRFKPADGLTITIGAEVYSGSENSLFDLVDDFMNGAYVSLRVDF